MKKLLTICAFLFPFVSICQVELDVYQMFYRSGNGGIIEPGLSYNTIPETQVTPIQFSARIKNNSGNAATNVYYDVTILEDGLPISTLTSDTINLCPACIDSFGVAQTFTPGTGNNYKFVFHVYSDESDTNPVNNEKSVSVDVDHNFMSAYRRDDGNMHITISEIYPNESAAFGNMFEIFQDGTICGVSIYIPDDPSNIGSLIYGQAYMLDTFSGYWDFWWENQTWDYEIVASDLGNYVDLYFYNLDVNTGDVVLIMAGHYGGAITAKFGQAQLVQPISSIMLDHTSQFWSIQNNRAVMVFPLFSNDSQCGVGIDDIPTTSFKLLPVTPNPSHGLVSLQYQLPYTSDVMFQITDIGGKLVNEFSLNNEPLGLNHYEFDASSMQDGVYFITLKTGDQQQTQKFIIQK